MDEQTDWLDAALQPLGSPARPHEWASAEALQRRAHQHRRRRLAAACGGTSLLVALLLVVSLVSFGSTTRQPSATSDGIQRAAGPDGSTHLVADVRANALVGDAAAMASLARAEVGFALRLTRLELAANPGGNVLISPMSAHIDLSMLELAAAGATARQIASVLQSSGVSPARQAAAWNGLVQALQAGQSPGELHLANSIWLRQGLHVEAPFLRQAAATFGNDTYQVDFGSNSATQAINAWVAQATARRITQLYRPGDLTSATEVVLANALHFHAAWRRNLLSQAAVERRAFYPAGDGAGSGSPASVSVPTVVDSQARLRFSRQPTYDAVQLPYTNGRYAALLVEPTAGSVSALLAQLSTARLSDILASLHSGYLNFSMPELKLSSLESLNQPLSTMGMAPAFLSADFSPMLGPEAGQQAVGDVQQAATLDVNRWGTDAAAATGSSVIAVSTHGIGVTIAFDHPYLFLVRDTRTGTILFSTVVSNPAAA